MDAMKSAGIGRTVHVVHNRLLDRLRECGMTREFAALSPGSAPSTEAALEHSSFKGARK